MGLLQTMKLGNDLIRNSAPTSRSQSRPHAQAHSRRSTRQYSRKEASLSGLTRRWKYSIKSIISLALTTKQQCASTPRPLGGRIGWTRFFSWNLSCSNPGNQGWPDLVIALGCRRNAMIAKFDEESTPTKKCVGCSSDHLPEYWSRDPSSDSAVRCSLFEALPPEIMIEERIWDKINKSRYRTLAVPNSPDISR
jgi:hypothetical protein